MSHLEGIWDNALGTFLTFSDPSPSIDVDACSDRYFLGLWGFASLWWGGNTILRAAALVSSLWELFLLLFCSRFLDLGSAHHISPSWSQDWRRFWTCEPLGPWGPQALQVLWQYLVKMARGSFVLLLLVFLSLVVMFTDPVKFPNVLDKITEARHFSFSVPTNYFLNSDYASECQNFILQLLYQELGNRCKLPICLERFQEIWCTNRDPRL